MFYFSPIKEEFEGNKEAEGYIHENDSTISYSFFSQINRYLERTIPKMDECDNLELKFSGY